MIIEAKILNYLLEQNIADLDTDVYMEVPVNPPKRYITIEKTGGGSHDNIEEGVFAIQSRSRISLLDAATINHAMIMALKSFRDVTENVFSCTLNSDYNYTNTETKEYRYQAVFTIIYQED